MKKINNKILIIVLAVLAGVFVLSRIFRSSSRESNLRKELIKIDTASVSEILLYPNVEKNKEIKLIREGKNWVVKMGNHSATAEAGSVASAMNYLVHIKPLRLITKNKSKWNEFQVSDTSTRVKVMNGSEVLADVHIGKIGFNQQPGQQQFSANGIFTYLRLSQEAEVYSVEGFLEPIFNKPYNDWRNKSFLRLKQTSITKVVFNYPADSGFVLEKKDKKWWVNMLEADSVRVNNFLSQIENKNATTFADEFTANTPPQASIQFTGNGVTMATVQAWKQAGNWAVSTSHQPGIYFSSKGLESVLERKKGFLIGKKNN